MKCGSYKSAEKVKGEVEANNEAKAKSKVKVKNDTSQSEERDPRVQDPWRRG